MACCEGLTGQGGYAASYVTCVRQRWFIHGMAIEISVGGDLRSAIVFKLRFKIQILKGETRRLI